MGSASVNNTTPSNVSLTTKDGICSDKPHYSFVERYKEAYIIELQEFIKCVRNDENPKVTGVDALAAVKIAQAAGTSFKHNKPVRVER